MGIMDVFERIRRTLIEAFFGYYFLTIFLEGWFNLLLKLVKLSSVLTFQVWDLLIINFIVNIVNRIVIEKSTFSGKNVKQILIIHRPKR